MIALKTAGDLQVRASTLARRVAPVAGLVVLGFVSWTDATADRGVVPNLLEVTAVLAVVAAAWLLHERSDGWAFAATSSAIAATVLSLFVDLYPRVMVSSTCSASDLTVQNTASGAYALKVVTVVTVILLPAELVYQAWTYYVFCERVRTVPSSAAGEPVGGP